MGTPALQFSLLDRSQKPNSAIESQPSVIRKADTSLAPRRHARCLIRYACSDARLISRAGTTKIICLVDEEVC
jgi:hypothetical protein